MAFVSVPQVLSNGNHFEYPVAGLIVAAHLARGVVKKGPLTQNSRIGEIELVAVTPGRPHPLAIDKSIVSEIAGSLRALRESGSAFRSPAAPPLDVSTHDPFAA